jgi:hypothetical protein
LLIGLYELIKETDKPDLLYNLFDSSFPRWIESYVTRYIGEGKPVMGNDDHYDAVLMLLSTSVHDKEGDEGVRRVREIEAMCGWIADIIKYSSWEHDRYIPCLNLIANLSNSSAEAATDFVDRALHGDLLGAIAKSMKKYKVSQSLFDENSIETVS